MFFYIDESGHTGPNLFDHTQPWLYYGILRSKHDLEKVAIDRMKSLRNLFGVTRLHAADLGIKRLEKAIPNLLEIQREYDLRFDFCRVKKVDQAIICFFDQVFDSNLNQAVPHHCYSTPLRYLMLMKVASLFNEKIAESAWTARIDINRPTATQGFLNVCKELLHRVSSLPDHRSRELIKDALQWAIDNPQEIHYNCMSKSQVREIAPNMIGFQLVMQGISRRLGGSVSASRIVVDQQSQFNKTQKKWAEYYRSLRDASVPLWLGPEMPQFETENIPETPPEFLASANSIGLELVDICLWLFLKKVDKFSLPICFNDFITALTTHTEFNEVSLSAICERWEAWFSKLPDLTPETKSEALKIIEKFEQDRKDAMKRSS